MGGCVALAKLNSGVTIPLMRLPLNVQLVIEGSEVEEHLCDALDFRAAGEPYESAHEAAVYSLTVLCALEGCIRLCRHLEHSPVLPQHKVIGLDCMR